MAGIVLALVLYLLAVTNMYLANLWPAGGEFSLLRTGGRAFLIDRIEPYSGTVPAIVQEIVYGRPAVSGEDGYILDIPFHLLIFYFPLALFPETLMARAFWLAFSEVAVAMFLYFCFRLVDRRIPIPFIGMIVIGVFLSYYTYLSLLEGSPVILLGLAYAGILLSIRAGQDELAGAIAAFSAFHWEVGGPFLFFVAIWIFLEKRWRAFAGAGMFLTLSLVLSFLWYPDWLLPFLRAAWNSYRLGLGYSTHELFAQLWPQYGGVLGWVVTAILVFALGFEWLAARGKNFNHFLWVACLTLVVTPLLGQSVELDHLFPLALPILVVVLVTRERWKTVGDGIAFLLLWLLFGLPWILETQDVPEALKLSKEQTLFFFWPVFTIVSLYWTRWWMVRPPRTWLDRFALKEQL